MRRSASRPLGAAPRRGWLRSATRRRRIRGRSSWDPVTVSTSTRALVAADDADQVVAVSASALALLGYDDPRELVGSRLICIIPPRYHQAHIAGLTLHLASGRGPLLGNRIAVPVLRADRTEQVLDLQIESRHLPDGRAVFVAELFG